MRKLLNKDDKKLIEWLQKSITSNRYEAEFLYSSATTKLNDVYKNKIETMLPKVLNDDGEKLELETVNPVVSCAIVDKSAHQKAINSALEDLKNNKVQFTVYYRNIPHVKSYVMINDAFSRRGYDLLGLQSILCMNPDEFIKFLSE